MTSTRKPGTLVWLKQLFGKEPAPPTDLQRAQDLIRAIDAGGVPLNPARVNAIARSLSLDVPSSAPMDETIERIREALARGQD